VVVEKIGVSYLKTPCCHGTISYIAKRPSLPIFLPRLKIRSFSLPSMRKLFQILFFFSLKSALYTVLANLVFALLAALVNPMI
jgi:hypothetical protein